MSSTDSSLLPKPTVAKKLEFTFELLKPCGKNCAEEGLIKCSIKDTECMCISESWLKVFSACFKKDCALDEYKYTADTYKKICSQDGAGGIQPDGAAFLAEIKLIANSAPTSTSTTPSLTSTAPNSPSLGPSGDPISSSAPSGSPGIFTEIPTANSSDGGLGTGGIIGVSIGAGLATLLFILLGWYIYRLRKKPYKGDAYDNAPHFSEVKESEYRAPAPYSAQYIGSASDAVAYSGAAYGPQGAHPLPQHQPLVPPNIPNIVEAEDPSSVSQMIKNSHRR